MQHADFRINTEFYTATGLWRCTDVGTRVVVAIRLDAPDASWYAGPPYAVAEHVFDEYALEGCSVEPLTTAKEPDTPRPSDIGATAMTAVDARTALARLGFERAGMLSPLEGGTACKAIMEREITGCVVYAHVVGNEIKKFGITKAPLRQRVGQNASTITQVIALWENRASSDARWHHRPFDSFKLKAPEVIRAGQTIEVWALQSSEEAYRLLERELNARFDTMRNGWAMQLG